MDNLTRKIAEAKTKLVTIKSLLQIEKKVKEAEELRQKMMAPDFWQDNERAVKLSQRAGSLANDIEEWDNLVARLGEIDTEPSLLIWEKDFSRLEFKTLFSAKYDNNDVILAIHAGTGGVDAQDWAEMMSRMYLRFCEKKNWSVEIIDRNYGNEAGIKSLVIQINGAWAYGYLKGEHGVHRLLRISPFDGDGLRHTSFALVEVMPMIEGNEEITINEDEIRVDVFRSSGPGGQSVNTTDSAVRLTHLPSGVVVSCQSERSQHQNKENAFKMLKAKLYQLALAAKEAEERELKGEVQTAEWGQQIRSYFLYGNRLVKDHRTNYETNNVEAVLDGDLEPFIEAYLRRLASSS